MSQSESGSLKEPGVKMRGMLVQLVAMMAIISVLGGITLSCGKFAEEYTANRTLVLAMSNTPDWWEDKDSLTKIVDALDVLSASNDGCWMEVNYSSVPRLDYGEELVFKTAGIASETPTIRVYGIRKKTTNGYVLYVENQPMPNPSGRSWVHTVRVSQHEGEHYGS